MAKISFLHAGLPNGCISPNILTAEDLEEYPGMAGTGFIARRCDQLFYITARHCLTQNHEVDVGVLAAKLHVPFRLEGRIEQTSDYIQFEQALSLKHNSEDLPGKLIDLLVLPISKPKIEKNKKHLLSRAVKLPPTGQWVDSFFEQPIVQEKISNGKGPKFIVIGYPTFGTNSEIIYPKTSNDSLNIHMQAAKFYGYFAEGSYPDRFKLTEVTWAGDLNGFSGSPVFFAFRNKHGHQYALAGMAVTGGNGMAQFIKISVITQSLGRLLNSI
jgi:hypothetical protein